MTDEESEKLNTLSNSQILNDALDMIVHVTCNLDIKSDYSRDVYKVKDNLRDVLRKHIWTKE